MRLKLGGQLDCDVDSGLQYTKVFEDCLDMTSFRLTPPTVLIGSGRNLADS